MTASSTAEKKNIAARACHSRGPCTPNDATLAIGRAATPYTNKVTILGPNVGNFVVRQSALSRRVLHAYTQCIYPKKQQIPAICRGSDDSAFFSWVFVNLFRRIDATGHLVYKREREIKKNIVLAGVRVQRHTFGNLGQSMTRVRATTDTQQKRTFGCNKSSSFSTRLLVLLYTCSGCHANAILNVLKQPPKRTARNCHHYTTPTYNIIEIKNSVGD